MQILRSVLAVALMAVVAGVVSAEAPKKAAKKAAPVRGTIVAVEKDQDKNSGTLTVKVIPGKKNPDAPAEEKKFQITDTTKIEKIVGKPKDGEAKPAAFTDLAKGGLVLLTVKDSTIESIKILEGKKKKK